MPHFDLIAANWHDVGGGYQRAEVVILDGETAVDPGSTKRVIHGPAHVIYSQAPDGGIDLVVKRLPHARGKGAN
jgi:hypothetical protein